MAINQVRIAGWHTGAKTVSLTLAVREATSLSLADAKNCVDQILGGQVVVLDLTPEADPDSVTKRLSALGAIVEAVVAPTSWELWRQDDNGNRVVVRSFDSRAEAEQEARRMEALGHKQLYWVARA